jgi:hypothetical protein
VVAVGRLGEEATSWRPPGVQRNVVNQSTGGSIRYEHDKDDRVLGLDHKHLEETDGEV